MKKLLHAGQPGIEQTKIHARRTIYYTIYYQNTNKDIETVVPNCERYPWKTPGKK